MIGAVVMVGSPEKTQVEPRTVVQVLPWVTTACRLGLAGVLIWAGAAKIGAPALSVQAVEAYELLPEKAAEIVGYVLPVSEIVLGVLLVVGLLTRITAVASGLLMALFVAGIASAWARGLNIDCGCFGGGGQLAPGESPEYLQEILRDLGYIALAAWIVWRAPGRLALDTVLGLAAKRDTGGEEDVNDDDEERH
ncbi:MauE/DoxX family redox-associated membrane protein [Rhizohabitans arisaemae]|uniref:MauE/DoxX family redox-associated membrane protein n=1 Tax=Rhizohabitans arisaemae TaxID=2720610 RepID=UPI0024B24AFE|nr:MauE/DoxX family redox-associated membrane protein [Rhizohabitans arisaemae]